MNQYQDKFANEPFLIHLGVCSTIKELEAFRKADVILAKGMGNTETMFGCGYNVYYAFLVKCQMFVERFGKPLMTPMLVAERT